MEYVPDYQQVARDYNLSFPQKLQFLHNLLRGDAKRFYLNSAGTHMNTFQQAVDRMDKEYNSVVRQNREKLSMQPPLFRIKASTPSEALERVY